MPGNLDSDTSPEEWVSGVEQSGQSDNSLHHLMPSTSTTTTNAMATGGQGRALKALRADNVTVWVPQNRLRVMKAKGGSVESYFRPPPGGGVAGFPSGGGSGGGSGGASLQRGESQDAPAYARISRRHSPLRSLSYSSADSTTAADFNNPHHNHQQHNNNSNSTTTNKNNPLPLLPTRRHLERQKTINESAESINHIKSLESSEYKQQQEEPSAGRPAGPEQLVWAASVDSCSHDAGYSPSNNPPSPYGDGGRRPSSPRLIAPEEERKNMHSMQKNNSSVERLLLLAPPLVCQRSTSAGNVYESVRDNTDNTTSISTATINHHSVEVDNNRSNTITTAGGSSGHHHHNYHHSDNLYLPDNNYYSRRARSVSPRATGSRIPRDTPTTYRERLKDSSSQVDIQHTHFHRNITMSCDHEARDEESEMSVPTRIVLLACGSFNPVTNMHLRMFEIARDALHQSGLYRVVGGIISPVSDAYDKKGLQPATHRCAMIRLALKSSDWIRLDTWECERDTWSPTVEVLRHQQGLLQSSYNANIIDGPTKRRKIDSNLSVDSDYSSSSHQNNGNLNDVSPITVRLLCGADLLESFAVPDLWKPEDKEEIVKNSGIVCISRAGTNPDQFIYESDLLSKFKNNIQLVTEWMHNDISSTKIRRALLRGESVKYLVQDSVIDYIIKNKLYGAGENKLMNYTTPSPNRDSPEFQIYLQMSPKSQHLAQYSSTSFRQNSYERKNSNERHNHSACNEMHSNYTIDREIEAINHNDETAYNQMAADPRHNNHGFRRRKDINYDEEQRRNVPRRSESLDRRQLTRNATFDKNSDFNKRVSSSFDSLDSPPRSPKASVAQCSVSTSHSDMSGLVRRVQGMRIVSLTPETSV